MSSLEMVKLQVCALELKLGVERAGHRFWLFVFNWLFSLVVVVVGCWFVHLAAFVLAVILAFVIIIFVNVTGLWNGMVEKR